MKSLFDTPAGESALRHALVVAHADPSPEAKASAQALRVFQSVPSEIDKLCQCNISSIGDRYLNILSNMAVGGFAENIDWLYRFVMEIFFSIDGELSMELREFKKFVDENENRWSHSTQDQLKYARTGLILYVIKNAIAAPELRILKELPALEDRVKKRLDAAEETLAHRAANVDRLANVLKGYENAFNFVALDQGFEALRKEKESALKISASWVRTLGVIAITPIALELIVLFTSDIGLLDLKKLIAVSVPTFSFAFILLYYFRIALRDYESLKVQLLQIQLRQALCRFIQSYSEHAAELKKRSDTTLEKFESIIFSNIVATDEKVPATFDGIEHLANLVKSAKSS